MRFSFTDEQEQFRGVLRRFLAAHSPSTAVRQAMASAEGYDRASWQRMNDTLGLAGIHVSEDAGGAGFGYQELGIVMEEMGRALCCAPYLGSAVLATEALKVGATRAEQAEFLPALANGVRTATLAWMEASDRWSTDAITMAAREAAGGYLLDGVKRYVVDGHTADIVIVAACAPAASGEKDMALFAVQGTSSGLERRLLTTTDQTRKLAELSFDAVPARRLGAGVCAAAALARTLDHAAVALAHELVGAAQALLESAVEYAKIRMQFGRPIGSFQAIKHKCAAVLLDVELAKAAVYYAAAAQDEDDPQAPALAAMAKALASEAALRAGTEAIQIHGGIGFTWDHDTHLWFKRVQSAAVLLGDAAWHRERYLSLTAVTA